MQEVFRQACIESAGAGTGMKCFLQVRFVEV